MNQFNQPQQETVQANPMDDIQKWLQIFAMMKKNNMGFWKKGDTGTGKSGSRITSRRRINGSAF